MLPGRIDAWGSHGSPLWAGFGAPPEGGLVTDHHRLTSAGRRHPLKAGVIEVAGCPVLGFGWDSGDHSMRHRGERAAGQVYPVGLGRAVDGGTVPRWAIPPGYEDTEDTHASR